MRKLLLTAHCAHPVWRELTNKLAKPVDVGMSKLPLEAIAGYPLDGKWMKFSSDFEQLQQALLVFKEASKKAHFRNTICALDRSS